VVPQPGAQETGASALEKSLGTLPEAVQQSGQLAVRTEELQAHQRKAQDLLDSSTAQQDTRPQLQTLLTTLQEGPYQTLPKDFLEQGNALIAERAKTLNPQARALYVERAKGDLVPLHAAALQTYSQRRDENVIQSVTTELQWFQQQYQQAGSDFERAYHRESMESLLTSLRDAGLVKGSVVTKTLTDLDQGMQWTQAQTELRLRPKEALDDIVARMQGGPATNPAFQQIPPDKLPELFDDAQKRLTQKVTLKEAEHTRAKRQLQEQQEYRAGLYRNQLYTPGITVSTLMGLLDPIKKDFELGLLSREDHTQLLGHIETLMHQQREEMYKDRDAPKVAQDLYIRIETAQTPEQLATIQGLVETNKDHLSSSTTQRMLARITERGEHNDPLNDNTAKEAQKLFLSGAFPGGIVPAVMDKIDGGIQAKTAEGLLLLKDELRRIYDTQGRDAYRAQAQGVALRLKDLYFPTTANQQGPIPAGMPPAFAGVTTFEDALIVIDAIKPDQATKRRLYEQAKESLPRKSALQGVPQGTGLDKVPGVTKPKTPYAPMEQR
jgi:hypothetical protein